MLVLQGKYLADVDVEKTRAVYRTLPPIDCGCIYCRNFTAAAQAMDAEMQSFLRSLGMDPETPSEAIAYMDPHEELILYEGIYHAVGHVIQSVGDGERAALLEKAAALDTDQLRIDPGVVLLEAEFEGLPVVQLDAFFRLPWRLDEPRPET